MKLYKAICRELGKIQTLCSLVNREKKAAKFLKTVSAFWNYSEQSKSY